ncbi:MAG: hypothetical protein QM775_08670 [Pirellulales bacterium]
MLRHWFIFGFALTVASAGCQGTSSTMLTRDESNTTWDKHTCLSGVPITLKVPTHVKVYIYETYFLDTVDVGGVPRVQRIKLKYPVRDYAQEFIYTEKIFTVDFKRPAAGMYNLKLEMTKDQYISKVQHDVTDKTIEQVSEMFQRLAPKGLVATPSALDSTDIESQIGTIKSVSAVGIFEIDAPDFEQQVTCFINHHLNRAHDAFVTEPHIQSINRVPAALEGPLEMVPGATGSSQVPSTPFVGTNLVPAGEPIPAPGLPPQNVAPFYTSPPYTQTPHPSPTYAPYR